MSIVDTLGRLINVALFASSLRMTTPVLYATLGGIFSSEAGVLNVGLEGLMIIGAFFGVVGSVALGSAWGGLLVAILACLILSLAFAAVHLEWGADEMIVGLALNIFGYGLTTYLLVVMYDVSGYYSSEAIVGFQPLRIPGVQSLPLIGSILSGQFALVYLGFLAVLATWFVLYRTPWGFWLRSVGESPEAAEAVGINLKLMKYSGVLIGGILCAVGGAFLSLAHLNLFSEEMTAGRGFLALAAVNFGDRRPLKCLAASLIFGFADAFAIRLQRFGLPSQLVLMLPYIATVVILTLSAIQRLAAQRARMSVRG
ncbi:MAG: ABC transporter permease [Anaerolineales bacterium]|nr:MAG: ABC transporter permease [Anaerolineales bacterium]